MRIFHGNHRINFVDDQNVFVGFDFSSGCCEEFGYKITNVPPVNSNHLESLDCIAGDFIVEFPGYNFDTKYIVQDSFGDDSGSYATFKCVNESGEVLFISIWNDHNGYYGHGFDMVIDQNGTKLTVVEGCL